MTWTASRGRTFRPAMPHTRRESQRDSSRAMKPGEWKICPHCPAWMSHFSAQYGQRQITARSRRGRTRLAHQLAKNTVAHEAKLLADGKSRADVYTKLLPGYLAAKDRTVRHAMR